MIKLKGLIFDVRRFSTKDGPGIRTTVFFKGCTLSCLWCHNPEGKISELQHVTRINRVGVYEFHNDEVIGKRMTVDEVMKEVLSDLITYEESGGGVTFSGGEPLEQNDFLLELMKESKKNNLHTALDTTGYASVETIQGIIDYTDLFLYDLKLMDDDEHIKYTGVSNKSILNNLDFILERGKEVIIRFPVIPGINDTRENILQMKEYIGKHKRNIKEIHLLPYHNIADNKYNKLKVVNAMKDVPNLKEKDLKTMKKEFKSIGLKVKIGG
jgi:pyruvate formate lyase activating enzyme